MSTPSLRQSTSFTVRRGEFLRTLMTAMLFLFSNLRTSTVHQVSVFSSQIRSLRSRSFLLLGVTCRESEALDLVWRCLPKIEFLFTSIYIIFLHESSLPNFLSCFCSHTFPNILVSFKFDRFCFSSFFRKNNVLLVL